jgi:hypothetical protein
MTFQRKIKYEILKLDDIRKYLGLVQKEQLEDIIKTIQNRRELEGKSRYNSYVVVNEAEPYAEVVWKLIEIAETNSTALEEALVYLQRELEAYCITYFPKESDAPR